MSLQSNRRTWGRSTRPVAAELAAVIVALVALSVWQYVAREFLIPAVGFAPGGPGFEAVDSLLVAGGITGGLLLVGVVAVVVVYTRVRNVAVGIALPSTDSVPTVVAAVLAPVALVTATKLVGTLTGTTYSALLLRSYGPAATVEHFVSMTILTLFVGVPMLVLVCQVLVQGSVRRVVDGDTAVALTTLVGGFLLVDASGGLDVLPEFGRTVGAGLFVAAIAVALYGTERFERSWVRYLSVLPVAILLGGTVVAGIAAVETVPEVLFVGVKLAVIGVAASTYDRTDSLLVPAVVYASFLASSEAVVYVFEIGVQS
ncbi:hypothetical protein GJ631_04350 [Natronomonas sp. CBA1123]|jgi:hypothetical protein|uniref:hypothetical protein n=1 Tax=Natronomonas sp. CBA1123 TaxID=2668070 RepID=UPI0012EA27EA|nr:hypothetical protein [Natronomonas sp. CBA1123]MUV85821.1 hypothetical protein [Natronomonas sp. CBA1123]